jgi:bacterioferritin-associated ferredoxin
MSNPLGGKTKPQIICYCNSITYEKISGAIRRGCRKLDALMNATTAGLGQCGGTCKPDLIKLIQGFNDNGEFPEIAQPRGQPRRVEPKR